MMGVSHATSGAAVWIAFTGTMPVLTSGIHHLDPVGVILGSFVCAGAALLPDADHHSATIAQSVPVFGRLATGAVGAVSGGHRHGAHSLIAAAVVGAIAWLLTLFSVTRDGLGTFSIGTAIGAAALVCFGVKARGLVRSWGYAWVIGALLGTVMVFFAPDSIEWFPYAVVIGFVVHLAGDFLTTGGLPGLLWPIKPRPPRAWRRTPVLSRMWMSNGYVALPILGNTGSAREILLGAILGLYVLVGVVFESLIGFGADVSALF